MSAEKVIETKDLFLKKASREDWRDIYQNLWCHPESAEHMLWDVTCSEEEALARIERTVAFQRDHRFAFFVYEKRTGKAIGFAGLIETEPHEYEDIGIALGPAFWGKGYGTQIVSALAEELRAEGAHKITASCRRGNAASLALQKKCGFVSVREEDRTDPRNNKPYVLVFSELVL